MRDFMRHFCLLDLQAFTEGGGSLVNTTTGTANAYTGATTTTDAMSSAMKTYYDTELLENARDEAVYSQLGRTQALPKNHGKSVEWRRWNTLPEPDKLQEGVIPEGKPFGQSALSVPIAQYGEYVSVSDQLELHAIDDTILGATEEVGAAMGKKREALTRDAIMAGASCVMTAPAGDGAAPEHLWQITAESLITGQLINRAVTELKKKNAPRINGKYVAVIHPSVAMDLRNDAQWLDVHKYDATTEIFNGEIGELHGVRFIESTLAPVMAGAALGADGSRYLSITAGAGASAGTVIATGVGRTGAYKLTVTGLDPERDYADLVGQYVLLEDTSASAATAERLTVTGVDTQNNYVYTEIAPATTVASGDFLLPGNGGMEKKAANEQVAIYATMIFGKDAFGVVDPEGAGMEMIIKNKDAAGGPLNQFSTVGGKMSHAAKVLYPSRVLALYTGSTNSAIDESNWRM